MSKFKDIKLVKLYLGFSLLAMTVIILTRPSIAQAECENKFFGNCLDNTPFDPGTYDSDHLDPGDALEALRKRIEDNSQNITNVAVQIGAAAARGDFGDATRTFIDSMSPVLKDLNIPVNDFGNVASLVVDFYSGNYIGMADTVVNQTGLNEYLGDNELKYVNQAFQIADRTANPSALGYEMIEDQVPEEYRPFLDVAVASNSGDTAGVVLALGGDKLGPRQSEVLQGISKLQEGEDYDGAARKILGDKYSDDIGRAIRAAEAAYNDDYASAINNAFESELNDNQKKWVKTVEDSYKGDYVALAEAAAKEFKIPLKPEVLVAMQKASEDDWTGALTEIAGGQLPPDAQTAFAAVQAADEGDLAKAASYYASAENAQRLEALSTAGNGDLSTLLAQAGSQIEGDSNRRLFEAVTSSRSYDPNIVAQALSEQLMQEVDPNDIQKIEALQEMVAAMVAGDETLIETTVNGYIDAQLDPDIAATLRPVLDEVRDQIVQNIHEPAGSYDNDQAVISSDEKLVPIGPPPEELSGSYDNDRAVISSDEELVPIGPPPVVVTGECSLRWCD